MNIKPLSKKGRKAFNGTDANDTQKSSSWRMAAHLPIRYQEAKTHEQDYLEFLESLVNDEIARRKDNLLKTEDENRPFSTVENPRAI